MDPTENNGQEPEGEQETTYTEAQVTEQMQRLHNEYALRTEATKRGIADTDLVIGLIDWNQVTLDPQGRATNVGDLVTAIHDRLKGAVRPGATTVINPERRRALPGTGNQTFTRSQLRDPEFFTKNEKAIMEAAREGRILDE